jgi:type VI protein secretion system component Hcp
VVIADEEGNSCSNVTEVGSDLPVDASPPTVTANEHTVGKQLNYDSTTETGDISFTTYAGGTCNGATFDSTGANEISSGSLHFVITDDGKRVDFLVTTLTNSTGSIGDFSLSGTNLRQTR